MTMVDASALDDRLVHLPTPLLPEVRKKVLIFDMDETLIHCVDDIESQNPDVILEIDFEGEETVCAGINIRPYVMECLQEANKTFQVIVFTASHQTYADAILDYLDPQKELIHFRMYRQHCLLTPEGYYVKDLRVIANRRMEDLVIVDNSVYSFAY
jgi:CTD small phosphatase-like protein 2